MTTKAKDAAAAAAAELENAKDDLAADGTPAAGPPDDGGAGAPPPPAGPDDGGLTPPITQDPAANPRDRTATRARRARRVTEVAPDKAAEEDLRADAANVLRCHLEEVLLVEDTDDLGPVATTVDGQRYQLTGTEPGDYVWLPQRPTVPHLLGR